MFDKIKALLVILLFAYLGYMGWKVYTGRPVKKPSVLSGEATRTDADRDVLFDGPAAPGAAKGQKEEVLTPLQEIHRELAQVESSLFASLSSGANEKSTQLKALWGRSQREYQAKVISEEDAKILSALITKLNGISNERALYVKRHQELDLLKPTSFDSGLTVEEKRNFAEKHLNRQWSEYVSLNRQSTREMINSLSE